MFQHLKKLKRNETRALRQPLQPFQPAAPVTGLSFEGDRSLAGHLWACGEPLDFWRPYKYSIQISDIQIVGLINFRYFSSIFVLGANDLQTVWDVELSERWFETCVEWNPWTQGQWSWTDRASLKITPRTWLPNWRWRFLSSVLCANFMEIIGTLWITTVHWYTQTLDCDELCVCLIPKNSKAYLKTKVSSKLSVGNPWAKCLAFWRPCGILFVLFSWDQQSMDSAAFLLGVTSVKRSSHRVSSDKGWQNLRGKKGVSWPFHAIWKTKDSDRSQQHLQYSTRAQGIPIGRFMDCPSSGSYIMFVKYYMYKITVCTNTCIYIYKHIYII